MSDWINHVKQYAKANNCTYGEALKKASATFKKGHPTGFPAKSKKKRSRKNRGTRRRGKK